jgi:hypothetical protein
LVLFAAVIAPVPLGVSAQSNPQVSVNSQYILNRYGFAIVNETVTVKNNGTAAVSVPDVTIGMGNLTSYVISASITGTQNGNSTSAGTFLVKEGQSLAAGGNLTFSLKVLLAGMISHATNGSLQVMLLASPYVSPTPESLASVIRMPASTTFVHSPAGFTQHIEGTSINYSRTQSNVTTEAAVTSLEDVSNSSSQDFYPLQVYSASRVVSIGSAGTPIVTDTISLENLGTTALSTVVISPLTSSDGEVTVVPSTPLFKPFSASMTNYAIDLANYPALLSAQENVNYTLVFRYALASQYYTAAGGSVTMRIPLAPPMPAFIQKYTIELSLPAGAKAAGKTITDESPLETGTLTLTYGLSIGWALGSGVPTASVLFAVLLLGLFVSRASMTKEEETEEESATERASAMISAFEEKSSLIEQILSEIPSRDPNERGKPYFDELRGRLDAYRNRALQRLNEVRQKSTTQKFFELLNQLQTTEREVDRAARDILNLHEQFYTNRMRKEVFERLSPTYRKRLDKALNQLSEELHVAQREAKLL